MSSDQLVTLSAIIIGVLFMSKALSDLTAAIDVLSASIDIIPLPAPVSVVTENEIEALTERVNALTTKLAAKVAPAPLDAPAPDNAPVAVIINDRGDVIDPAFS